MTFDIIIHTNSFRRTSRSSSRTNQVVTKFLGTMAVEDAVGGNIVAHGCHFRYRLKAKGASYNETLERSITVVPRAPVTTRRSSGRSRSWTRSTSPPARRRSSSRKQASPTTRRLPTRSRTCRRTSSSPLFFLLNDCNFHLQKAINPPFST